MFLTLPMQAGDILLMVDRKSKSRAGVLALLLLKKIIALVEILIK